MCEPFVGYESSQVEKGATEEGGIPGQMADVTSHGSEVLESNFHEGMDCSCCCHCNVIFTSQRRQREEPQKPDGEVDGVLPVRRASERVRNLRNVPSTLVELPPAKPPTKRGAQVIFYCITHI